MDFSTGQSAMAEPQQVRVNFTTTSPDIELPEGRNHLLVPADFKRYGLSKVLNSDSMLDTQQQIPFDFLIDGAFLRTSLGDYLKENGLSFENTITLQYVKSLLPPSFQGSFEHDDWISAVDLLSDSSPAAASSSDKVPHNRLLSASYDGLLRIWNDSGSIIATSSSASQGGHSASIKAAKFISPSQVASAGLDRTVRIWKYSEADDHLSGSLKPTLELYGHRTGVESLDVHGPTSRVITAGSDGKLGLWSTSKSTAPAADPDLLPGAHASSAKKRKIASAAPQRGPLSITQTHGSPISAAVFHPNDATVAYTASQDHAIKTVDLTTSATVATIVTSHPLMSMCALPGASGLLAAGTSARHITLADPRASASTTSVMTLRGHRNIVSGLAPSPEHGEYSLASASYDGTCRIWDIRSARPGGADGVSGSVSEAVYVIERESLKGRKKTSDVPGSGAKVFGVAWDRQWGIVSGGEDKQVQINRGRDLLADS